ncbi:Biotrophy-associated secreted protein [Paramyrothecium foliicola]|nr:Biotrophy-associated secreted protein [Paramyrothecium foliicola]
MVRFALVSALAFATALALPQPQLQADPSGDKNIGNGQGGQFITGACLSDADCASACCATLGSSGICSGPGAAFNQGKQGCGFGGAGNAFPDQNQGNDNNNGNGNGQQSPPAGGNNAINENAAGSQNVGNGNGLQFITGQCLSDADCASGCCAGSAANSGVAACAARAVAEANGRTGCGFSASN